MDLFEFGDEKDVEEEEKLINVTIKMTEEESEMFTRIAKRERMPKTSFGAKIITKYLNTYIEDYKKSQP